MSAELSYLWEQALGEAEKVLSKPSFETWLKSTRPVALKNDTIIVEVPNDFTKDWLETRYKNLLMDVLEKVSSRSYSINFISTPFLEQEELENNQMEENLDKNFISETRRKSTQTNWMGSSSAASSSEVHTQARSSVETASPPQNSQSLLSLNPKYTFDSFVVGSCNRLAHAASLAVSEAPSKAYNPLFVYGGVGLGKTHLMHAIGHFVKKSHLENRVFYLSTEKFTNEFINAIRDNKTVDFRNKYRNIDVLLIDDIQFLAGKEQTQEEFFHTFNALHDHNKQIVISSDRPPKDIPTLEDRLRSRFEWGLITDIHSPDLETRIAILKKKAHLEGVTLPEEVFNFIANQIETNIRELEGALIRVMAFSSLNNASIDLSIAQEALKHILSEKKKTVTVDKIIDSTAQYFGITSNEIQAKKRSKNVAFPRQLAMFLSRELTEHSLPKIGEEFGGKDHSTVIHAHKKISQEINRNQEIKQIVDYLKRQLTTG